MASPGEMALLNQIMQNQTSTAQVPTPHDYSGMDGLFGRLFPKRDPLTGEQGGILANPLFRLGLNLLARSGPQARPHSLGQDIAGAVNDYSDQRDKEVISADNAVQAADNRRKYKEVTDQSNWAEGLNVGDFFNLGNPTGNPEALKAQTPSANTGLGQNNIGNIRPIGKSVGFQNYNSPEEGVQAIRDNLNAYYTKHGLNTLEGIISRWAPPSENPTEKLIQNATMRSGWARDQILNMKDPAVIEKLKDLIIAQEGREIGRAHV